MPLTEDKQFDTRAELAIKLENHAYGTEASVSFLPAAFLHSSLLHMQTKISGKAAIKARHFVKLYLAIF